MNRKATGVTLTVSTVHTVDNLDRRKRASREDGTAWHYDYNSRSEVAGAWKSRDGANAVRLPGMDRAYDYDNIGNRISAKEGGNGSGLARRTYAYATNELNLYTSVTRGAESGGKTRGVDFTGTAGSESMTVNGVVAQRSGPWWRAEVEPATATDLFVAGDVKANGTSLAAEPRKVPSPPTTLSLTAPAPNPIQYDLDGNLLCDGWRRYTWDGEQRLVKVETLFPAPHKTTTTFAYDAFGRRIAKTVTQKEWQASVEVDVIKEDLRFLYHGWNLAAVYKVATTWGGSTWVTDTTLTQSFVWGIDIGSDGRDATPAGHLAAPFSRAGGVGGLVLARFHQEPTAEQEHFPCYDGNGNVLALIAAKHEGGTTAAYDYDPFGNTVSATGPLAEKNPFRFSTKYTDGETGLVYYAYRYLDTLWGRWINRDPIEEDGGVNLLGFVGNCGTGECDVLGLDLNLIGPTDFHGIRDEKPEHFAAQVRGDDNFDILCHHGDDIHEWITIGSNSSKSDLSAHAEEKAILLRSLYPWTLKYRKLTVEDGLHHTNPDVKHAANQIDYYDRRIDSLKFGFYRIIIDPKLVERALDHPSMTTLLNRLIKTPDKCLKVYLHGCMSASSAQDIANLMQAELNKNPQYKNITLTVFGYKPCILLWKTTTAAGNRYHVAEEEPGKEATGKEATPIPFNPK